MLNETKLEDDNKHQAGILLKTQERLRAVFDNAPDLLIIADNFFNVLDVSAITIEDYHTSRDNIQGTNLNEMLTSETVRHLQTHKQAEFKTQLFDDIPVQLRYKHLESGENLLAFRNLTDQLNNQKTLAKLHDIKQKNIALSQVNIKLKNVLNLKDRQKILGHSQPMYDIEKVIDSVAPTSATVLIKGETGAFTGALKNYTGKFVQANQGTLFLDEVGELDLGTQAKLLRVLQEGEVQPIGSENTKHIDVRIITATNRNLEEMVSNRSFREDLYYRLNVVPINVPPLRNRLEDIQLLAEFFLNRYKKLYSIEQRILEDNTIEELEAYPWPENVRELQNVIERFVVLGHMPTLDIPEFYEEKIIQENTPNTHTSIDQNIVIESDDNDNNILSLAEVEKKHIIQVLEICKWVISGNKGAAQKLKLNPSTLRFRMQKLNITRD